MTTSRVVGDPTILTKPVPETSLEMDIIDIRHDTVEFNLKEEIVSSLRPPSGPKKLPTLILYDERGLQLFEEVSKSDILRARKRFSL